MVSQDSTQNQAQQFLHQFILSDIISGQNQHFDDAYESSANLRSSNTLISHSLPLLPSIHSLGDTMSRSINIGIKTHRSPHQPSLSLAASHIFIQSTPRKRFPCYFLSGEHRSETCNLRVQHTSDHEAGSSYASASSSTPLNRSYSTQSFPTAVGHSKYLKPVQSLLQEVVNVAGEDIDYRSNEKFTGSKLYGTESSKGGIRLSSECLKAEFAAEKHQLEIKIVKQLVALLEEVEERREKYLHEMEEVVSSFEIVAGSGAAKPYIALALQAMSKHFTSLRDAIVCEINIRRRQFSHDLPRHMNASFTQLSLSDGDAYRHSLQQLVMLQSQGQAWRPIRGLPETSVAILRSWLFEHFLHPYPNDSEKLMLASQAGLTKTQVSNWFINARVRLWKPMIEEMYREEFAGSSQDSNPSF
ncbi:BEL1-like homeodomain protein 11 [Carica papaya]|uniref:BEL1-like homeodomain protein 11 n=1 Tax=Carica papaya TaxID=3649 RepID=UPI000B8D1353|nr:BEL1-like homeodomain protein 11 [Carica papaya]